MCTKINRVSLLYSRASGIREFYRLQDVEEGSGMTHLTGNVICSPLYRSYCGNYQGNYDWVARGIASPFQFSYIIVAVF